MTPLNVLHVISSMKLGGAQTFLRQIIPALRPQVNSYVYPLRSRDIDITVDAPIIRNDLPHYDPRKITHFLRTCRQYKIDIIHTHLAKPALLSLFTKSRHSLPVIVHEHSPIIKKGFSNSIYRFSLKWLYKNGFAYLAVATNLIDALRAHINADAPNLYWVPNGIDLAEFSTDSGNDTRNEIRQQLQLSSQDILIGFIGRLDFVKGIDLVPDIMLQAIKQDTRLHIVIIGQGSLRPKIEKQCARYGISDHVHFVGFQSDVLRWLSALDIGLMPSRQEGLPLTALEYMAARVPLICSDVDGFKDVVSHHESALMIPSGQLDGYVQAILSLSRDEKLTLRLIENAYNRVQQFAVEETAKKILDIYIQASSA